MTWLTITKYLCYKWRRICFVCRNQNPVHSSFMTYHWVYNWVIRRVSHVEQELFTFPEHLSSVPVFSGIHVAWFLFFCVMLCRSLFVFLSFFFWPLCCLFFFELRLLITSLWQLQTFPDILGANLYSLKWFNFYFVLFF